MTDMQFPGADRAAGKVAPIKFPRTKVSHDYDTWAKQVEARESLVRAASHEAYDRGYRSGYVDGSHYGTIIGAVVGGLAVAILWFSWAPLQSLLATWGIA